MKHSHDPRTPTHQAPDLDPREAPLAALLASSSDDEALSRHARAAAPVARARMLMASRSRSAAGRGLVSAAPLQGWAVAAGLLIAIGLGGFFLLYGASPAGHEAQQVALEPVNAGLSPREDIVLREDAALSLFHDIETFGSLGVESDDLLALGE